MLNFFGWYKETISGRSFTKQRRQFFQANDKLYEGMELPTKIIRSFTEHWDHQANTQDHDGDDDTRWAPPHHHHDVTTRQTQGQGYGCRPSFFSCFACCHWLLSPITVLWHTSFVLRNAYGFVINIRHLCLGLSCFNIVWLGMLQVHNAIRVVIIGLDPGSAV